MLKTPLVKYNNNVSKFILNDEYNEIEMRQTFLQGPLPGNMYALKRRDGYGYHDNTSSWLLCKQLSHGACCPKPYTWKLYIGLGILP
ncbi:hypothetical protein NPIL_163721 [Nephila pilipes]|uniref:Uncharacterized protein n=1 Tax=Nephila pilipes TaxID=299642 RepID=A0A8X6MPE2_NEPPI|nr:hypothetical protein NPIL_163721 [Nephila pilipes]